MFGKREERTEKKAESERRKTMFTIDNDTKSELRLLMTCINAGKYGEDKVSATQHGYHHRVYCHVQIPKETERILRVMLGDDCRRMAFEELERAHGITEWENTLFEGKLGKDGKWHFEEPIESESLLALPFFSRVVPKKLVPAPRKQWNRKRWS
jgi:hypothetical protein